MNCQLLNRRTNTGYLYLWACLLVVSMVSFSTVDAQMLASTATETSVTLTWTAPGDDGNTGTATTYDLRYRTEPVTDANWGSATPVSGEPPPGPPGQTEVFTVRYLDPNYTYCFALKAADEVPNWSLLSNSVTVILPPTPMSADYDTENDSAVLTCAQISSYFPLIYQFALDTTEGFEDPTIKSGSVSDSVITSQFTDLEYGKTYYWRCRALAEDLSDTSSWSSFRQFSNQNNPPGAPVNNYPANGSDIIETPIILIVDNAVDPDGDPLTYSFWIAINSSFTTIVASQLNVPEGPGQTEVTFSSFSPTAGEQYWWRCQASDGDLMSSYSSPTWFLYAPDYDSCLTPPSIPALISPGNGEDAESQQPTLCVANSQPSPGCPNPLVYTFEVYADASLTIPVVPPESVSEGSDSTCYVVSSALPTGRFFYWRVRSSNGTAASAWSPTFSFHTPNTPPGVPAMVVPDDGDTVTTLAPELSVSSVTDPDGTTVTYLFEVSSFANFSTLMSSGQVEGDTGTITWRVEVALEDSSTYYWRARTTDNIDYSAYSPVRSFVVAVPEGNNPPSAPIPSSPLADSIVDTPLPTLIVLNGSDVDGDPLTYQFELYNQAADSLLAGATGVAEGSTHTAWTVTTALNDSATYQWRARCFDGVAYSSWTSLIAFTVNLGLVANNAPSAPTVQSPVTGSTVDTLLPTLIVINGTDADGDALTYDFELFNQAGDVLLTDTSGVAEGNTVTAWTVTTALYDSTTYRWRARCFDGIDYSPWTSLTEFTIDLGLVANQPPSLPTHLSPSNGSSIITTPIVLLIDNAVDPEGDPLRYDFWIYSNSSLTQLVESQLNVPETPDQTAATFILTPVSGQRYWWQVRVTDGINTTEPTTATWFEYWDLATEEDEYVAGTAGPGNGAVLLTNQPYLKAANITAEEECFYYFEVATDSSFASPVVSSPGGIPESEGQFTEWRVGEPLESGREYYWRVRANDYDYSPVASFYIKVAVYAAPNPVHLGNMVTFHLPDNAVDLLITTVSGETVLVRKGASGEWKWDLLNASGHRLAVGIYLWYVNGNEASGKIVIKP